MSVCVNHIKWLFSSLAFSTGPQMGRLDFAMNIFIEMFRKYATKEGDRLHLSRKELRDMFNAELCDLLQVVGRQKICCFNMMSSYYIIISFFPKGNQRPSEGGGDSDHSGPESGWPSGLWRVCFHGDPAHHVQQCLLQYILRTMWCQIKQTKHESASQILVSYWSLSTSSE